MQAAAAVELVVVVDGDNTSHLFSTYTHCVGEAAVLVHGAGGVRPEAFAAHALWRGACGAPTPQAAPQAPAEHGGAQSRRYPH